MKICKQLFVGLLTLASALILTLAAHAQTATCVILGSAQTQNRRVLAPNVGVHIRVECGEWDWCFLPFKHSAPWGNWGVSSNLGTPHDGNQFQGWKPMDGWMQWNSCTSGYPPPNCDDYNDQGCTKQKTTTGVNVHGGFSWSYPVFCPRQRLGGGWMYGCEDFGGTTYTVSQNFMSLYELDPNPCTGGDKDLVQSLYFPSVSAALGPCDAWFCEGGTSPWVTPTSYDDPVWPQLVDAQFRIGVAGQLWDFEPYGDCDQWACSVCDPEGWCPPCIPRCFYPPC